MLNILVVDVAASESGVLTILKQYYHELQSNLSNNYVMCISTPNLESKSNIHVLKFPWVKKSWLHRLFFDFYVARRLIKKYKIDSILSLQNTAIPFTSIPQTIYLHQPLPFVQMKFKFSESRLLWIYQNIMSHFIYSSLKKADSIIVQTNWLKDIVAEKCKISPERICVIKPKVNSPIKVKYKDNQEGVRCFFYPATPLLYKNHKTIVEAAMILKRKGVDNYCVYFTITGQENDLVNKLRRQSEEQKLPIVFGGQLTQEDMYLTYSKSTLVFPSYVETFGLPLLEARDTGAPILASDCPFSHEILDDYDNVSFFDPFSAQDLAKKMINLL